MKRLDFRAPRDRSRPFGVLPTIDGFDVIALDSGRPVDHRDTRQSANGVAYKLNNAAQNGPRALIRELAPKG